MAEGGFDFGALSDENVEESGDQGNQDEEAGEFFAAESESEEAGDGFSGLVTDDSESEGAVGTDDSDLADFLKDLQ